MLLDKSNISIGESGESVFLWEEGESRAHQTHHYLVSLVSLCSSWRELSLILVNKSINWGGESGESVFLREGSESHACR